MALPILWFVSGTQPIKNIRGNLGDVRTKILGVKANQVLSFPDIVEQSEKMLQEYDLTYPSEILTAE